MVSPRRAMRPIVAIYPADVNTRYLGRQSGRSPAPRRIGATTGRCVPWGVARGSGAVAACPDRRCSLSRSVEAWLASAGPKDRRPRDPEDPDDAASSRSQQDPAAGWASGPASRAWCCALLAAGGFVFLYQSIDIPDPNEDFQTQTSYVYYNDGKTELGTFATQNRDSIALDEMPQNIQDAVVAAENQSFWTDKGIDPKGIVRAAFSNAAATPPRARRRSPSSTSRSSTSPRSSPTTARSRRRSCR